MRRQSANGRLRKPRDAPEVVGAIEGASIEDALREGGPDPGELAEILEAGCVGVYTAGFFGHEALQGGDRSVVPGARRWSGRGLAGSVLLEARRGGGGGPARRGGG